MPASASVIGKYEMTDKTAIQRIQELDRERTALFEQAKEETLRRATQAVEDLNALGLKYRLVEGESAAGSRPQEKGQAEKKSAARSSR
jgi:hypothetical protein